MEPPGQARTLELVGRNFYWPGQRNYVQRYIDHCNNCHRIKPIRHTPFGFLKPLELLHRPWDMISMDFITAVPTSNGKDALCNNQLTNKNETLCCIPGHHESQGPSKPVPPTDSQTSRTAEQYCISQRVSVHLRLLEESNGSSRDIMQPQYSLPPINRWTDRTSQRHPRAIPLGILQLSAG